jgi:hypothetical protein
MSAYSHAKRTRFLAQLTLAGVDYALRQPCGEIRLLKPTGSVQVLCPLTAVAWHSLSDIYPLECYRQAGEALGLPRGMVEAIQRAADFPLQSRGSWWRTQLEQALGIGGDESSLH